MNKQISKLALFTSYMQQAATNQYGTADQYLTNFTWNNINLRTLLGDMWDKYELFNISLVEVSSSLPTSSNIIGNYQNVILNISGLPFINQTYDTFQYVNTNVATLGTYQFNTTAIASKTYQGNNFLTFSKTQEQCGINIFYALVSNNSSPSVLDVVYPQMAFIFNITGVEIDKDTNLEQRMKIK